MQAMKAIAPATGTVGPITAVGRKLSRVSSLRVRNAAASAVYSTTSTTDKFLNQVKSVPKNIEYGGGGGGGLQPKGPTQSFSKASDVSANVTSPPSGASLDSTSEIPTDTPSGIGGGDKEGSGAGPNKVTFEMSSSNSSSSFGTSEDEMEEYFPSSAKASQETRQEQQQQTIINTFLNQRTSYPGMIILYLLLYFVTYTAPFLFQK